MKILGITLSCRLKWDVHVSEVLKRASRRLYIIRCLKSILPSHDVKNIYHAIITSLFLYASPAFGRLPATLLSKMNGLQRRAHRIICGRDCSCDDFPDLSEKFLSAGLKFLNTCETEVSHPLHNLVPRRLPRTGHLYIPLSTTSRYLDSFFQWICLESNSMLR